MSSEKASSDETTNSKSGSGLMFGRRRRLIVDDGERERAWTAIALEINAELLCDFETVENIERILWPLDASAVHERDDITGAQVNPLPRSGIAAECSNAKAMEFPVDEHRMLVELDALQKRARTRRQSAPNSGPAKSARRQLYVGRHGR
jgi:hypothetical protein